MRCFGALRLDGSGGAVRLVNGRIYRRRNWECLLAVMAARMNGGRSYCQED